MIYIGIDPGKKGGISAIQQNGLTDKPRENRGADGKRFPSDPYVYIYPMPDTEQFILQMFKNIFNYRIGIWDLQTGQKDISSEPERMKAIIEKVHAFPGQGVTSMFTFGQGYGFLRGCLVALAIPFTEVTPQKWMKHFGLKKNKEETTTEYKRKILQKAQNLFPNSTVTLQTADSLMLAEYLRQTDRS